MIQNLIGGIYLSKKDTASAKQYFEKAVTLQPTYFPAIANLAKLDMRANKPELAKIRFEELLKKDKSNLEAMTALASLSASQGDQETARIWFERASNEHPDSLSAAQLLALHYSQNGEKQKALNFARKAQASNPTNPGFMELLAQTQIAVLDKSAALESYSKFASMLPESASAQFKVAVTQISVGNETEAIEALKKTLRIDPHFLDAQLALSTLLAKKGRFDEALVLSKQVQVDNEKSAVGFMQEGDILLAQKKNASAIQAYERALKLTTNGQAAIKLHNAFATDGKTKEANLRMTQWLNAHPNDQNSRLYFGMYLLEKSDDRKDGVDQLLLILKSEPNNVIVLNNLAWALGEMKDKRALTYAEKANQLAPNTAAVLDTMGWILLEQGDSVKGLEAIQKAGALQPESLDIRYHLAIALMKSGNKVKAKKELEYLLAKGKEFTKGEEARALLKQL
jgi:putative PEP-CTERM system TPR-repeat lipoprotein